MRSRRSISEKLKVFFFFFRAEDNETWIGLTKPLDECKYDDDYVCIRQGWQWEDDTIYDNRRYHEWSQFQMDINSTGREPSAGQLCAKIYLELWYGASCTEIYSCLCEKRIIAPKRTKKDCPFGWKRNKGTCYLMTTKNLGFYECVASCKKGQGKISSIRTEKEHNVLVNL